MRAPALHSADNAVFNEDDGVISFFGAATDLEDGDLSGNIQWTSDLDGAFVSPAALSIGVHTITASVTDSGGLIGNNSIGLTIEAHVNVVPVVTIIAPADNAVFNEDDGALSFAGTATDLEDGDLSGSIQWASDLDGAFVSPSTLSVGVHTITASVTDSGG